MNIFNELKQDIKKACFDFYPDEEIWNHASLETPKDPLNGDVATNIAMVVAAKQNANPREVAIKFKEALSLIPYIAHIEVAGPGFINFTIKSEKWHESIAAILNDNPDFWEVNVGNGERVNIEFVSANPTGPMHVGHARGAIYGDALANLLTKCGYEVTKEYYINDAGSQIDTLVESLFLRYKEAVTGQKIDIPAGLYPGQYLITLGRELAAQYQDSLLKQDDQSVRSNLKKIAVDAMMELIKQDLAMLGVNHDVFVSEQTLHDRGSIDEVVKLLTEKGLIYTGILPPPKGKIDEDWEPKEQLLLKSTSYGDDQDRPIKKSDGSWSYLAADFAYAKDKIDRGFQRLVYILGADHSGYVKRLGAVISALSDGKVKSDIRVSQLVNFIKDGEPIKMSKRSGNFMQVSDVVNEVGKDIIRFIMLTRRNDVGLDFDFAKVKEQSRDNPVFYVQYAHVRTRSIIARAAEAIPEAMELFSRGEYDLSLLNSEEEIQLIKALASWPRILGSAASSFEPQKIAYYLIDIASKFHGIWNLGKENNDYRFNIEGNSQLTAARLALAESIRKIIASGFELIGVTPMDKM